MQFCIILKKVVRGFANLDEVIDLNYIATDIPKVLYEKWYFKI